MLFSSLVHLLHHIHTISYITSDVLASQSFTDTMHFAMVVMTVSILQYSKTCMISMRLVSCFVCLYHPHYSVSLVQ